MAQRGRMAVDGEEDAEGICERLLPASSVVSDTEHASRGDLVFWKVTFLAGAGFASLFSTLPSLGLYVYLVPHERSWLFNL